MLRRNRTGNRAGFGVACSALSMPSVPFLRRRATFSIFAAQPSFFFFFANVRATEPSFGHASIVDIPRNWNARAPRWFGFLSFLPFERKDQLLFVVVVPLSVRSLVRARGAFGVREIRKSLFFAASAAYVPKITPRVCVSRRPAPLSVRSLVRARGAFGVREIRKSLLGSLFFAASAAYVPKITPRACVASSRVPKFRLFFVTVSSAFSKIVRWILLGLPLR